jgi:hypothetical protein
MIYLIDPQDLTTLHICPSKWTCGDYCGIKPLYGIII